MDVARMFGGSTGRWAGEQFVAWAKSGKMISPAALRTNSLLMTDEWKFFDDQLILESQIRLRGVADLIERGLVRNVPNGLAKTVLQYQKLTDMDAATVSLDGVTRSENDRMEFTEAGIPLPLTHKDFYINLRTLMASRENGEPMDTTYVRAAGRKVAEETERMLFLGGLQFAGLPIYGYCTHPDRNTVSFGSGGTFGAGAKTGDQILADITAGIALLEADRQYGPYGVYVPSDASLKMSNDYKTYSDKTIRERILELDGVEFIRVVDQLPSGNALLVQMTSDVVEMVVGEPLQTVQWDIHGGFQINFKAFQIMVPLIRSDSSGRSGIIHWA